MVELKKANVVGDDTDETVKLAIKHTLLAESFALFSKLVAADMALLILGCGPVSNRGATAHGSSLFAERRFCCMYEESKAGC